ncbi:ATP-dependent DNA helicase [Forsythia ovata]|uniref:ATP-dependent DNA helicase n=1 Tax=Forsythia ovata TaxID=205694 RepID=A0ABD1P4S7_9LAMI
MAKRVLGNVGDQTLPPCKRLGQQYGGRLMLDIPVEINCGLGDHLPPIINNKNQTMIGDAHILLHHDIDAHVAAVSTTTLSELATMYEQGLVSLIEMSPGGYNAKVANLSLSATERDVYPSSQLQKTTLSSSDRQFPARAAQNEEQLSQMVATQLYATLSPSKASVPHNDRITFIKDIQGLLPVTREPFWYMACKNCNRQSNGDYGETYFCLFCKSPQARAIPRARASIKLQDDTGMLLASIIGSPAELFLTYSANQLMECVDNHDKVRMSINTDQLFYLKAAPKNLESSVYTYEIILMMEDNVDPIEPMCTQKTMEHIQHDDINKTGTSIHQDPMQKDILGESSNNNSNVQVKRELADPSKNESPKKRTNQPNIAPIEDTISQMHKDDIAVTQNDNLSTDTANERCESDETPHDSDYASF